MKKLWKILMKEEGVTAIEYALMAGLISLAIVTALISIGAKLQTPFNSIVSILP